MKWCAAILAVALAPAVASAQGAATSWPGRDMKAAGLSTVYVLDDTGSETSGKVLRLEPDAIVLVVDGVERRFEAARVKRIDKRGDSLRNGAVIGAVVGAALGLLGMGLADCPGANASGPCPGFRAAGVLVSTGFYAAVGTGIDALRDGRTTVYQAPAASTRAARIAQRPRMALNLTFRW